METETTLVNYNKRAHDISSDSENEILNKKQKTGGWYYVLESESSYIDPSDDTETIYSYQEASTEFVQDTSDTLSETESDMIEFEIASSGSDSKDNSSYTCSSEPEDRCVVPLTFNSSDSSIEGGSSRSESPGPTTSSDRSLDSRVVKRLCVQCKTKKTIHPLLTCCDNCFKVKKRSLPPRINQRKKKRKNTFVKHDNKSSCYDSPSSSIIPASSQELDVNLSATLPSSQSSSNEAKSKDIDLLTGDLCRMCYTMPQNAGFIHKRIVHVVGCFQCSDRVWKTIGRCPICNVRIQSVAKIIIV